MLIQFEKLLTTESHNIRYKFDSIFKGEFEINPEDNSVKLLTDIPSEDFIRDLRFAIYVKIVEENFPDKTEFAAG